MKVAVARVAPKPDLPALPKSDGAPTPTGSRSVVFESGAADTAIYDRDSLKAGDTIAGPALVEEAASVTLVRPGQTLSVGTFGTLEIS